MGNKSTVQRLKELCDLGRATNYQGNNSLATNVTEVKTKLNNEFENSLAEILWSYFNEFTENFESGWFITNPYSSIFTDDFEANWFIDNIFNSLFSEDFEGEDW